MERSFNKQGVVSTLFIIAGMALLAIGVLFGLLGGLQYIFPGFLKQILSFEKVRPLHVSSVVFWILLAASGGVLTYLQQHTGKKLFSYRLAGFQLFLFALSIVFILVSYLLGYFGGREYWEFPPLLAVPLTIGWILFLVNFLRSIGSFRNQPVYVWMWTTGICFFLFTYLESNLWLIPYFRNNVINDMTIQWKSYGSMVGSWNMLIYGCAIFLMDKISKSQEYSRSSTAFALYFLGLFNLMFNWGHHIYTLPTHSWIKNVSYLVSMTELVLIGRIIYKWKSSISAAIKYQNHPSYILFAAADFWIFLTLLLAVAMSIPAINIYTHGTHITVAHTMGATIGINSFLLLGIAYDILKDPCRAVLPFKRSLNWGFWISNISLLVFWVSLIAAGVIKASWQMRTVQEPFSEMMRQLRPYFISFVISGAALMAGLLIMVLPLAINQLACYLKGSPKSKTVLTNPAFE